MYAGEGCVCVCGGGGMQWISHNTYRMHVAFEHIPFLSLEVCKWEMFLTSSSVSHVKGLYGV